MTRVSVVGLGKLGACMAACFAHKGFPVIGVDVNRRTIDLVNAGQPPVYEAGLAEMMSKGRDRLRATEDYIQAVRESEVTFIIVPTPSENHGGFSLKYVKEAGVQLGWALKAKPDYDLVVLSSTVMPGSTQYALLPILEREAAKRMGEDFGLCYSPEFIALGSVIRDFLNPDFALIGETSTEAGRMLAPIYKDLFDNNPPVARMSAVNAEPTKIAVNTYVTAKITFANLLAEVCEQLPGGDVDAVTSALGLDSRIGVKYLRGALGYGGTCFPRDNLAFSCLLEGLGVPADLPRTVDRMNRRSAQRVAQLASAALENRSGKVAVLGLANKPSTNVVEESQGIEVARRLVSDGVEVLVYDPVAIGDARKVLRDSVKYAESLGQCIEQAEVLVVTIPCPEFRALVTPRTNPSPKPIVIDAWRILRSQAGRETRGYIGLGLGKSDVQNQSRLRDFVGQIVTRRE